MPFHFIYWIFNTFSPQAMAITRETIMYFQFLLTKFIIITAIGKTFCQNVSRGWPDQQINMSTEPNPNIHILPVNFMKLIMTRLTPCDIHSEFTSNYPILIHSVWLLTWKTPCIERFIHGVYFRSMCFCVNLYYVQTTCCLNISSATYREIP